MNHGSPYAANCSLMFAERPLLERPAAAAAAGFTAVEFWWPFESARPGPAQVRAFMSAVADAGVQLIGLNFAAGDMPNGDRGLLSWVGREQEFRASVDTAVMIGQELGTTGFNALYGNRLSGVPATEQDECAVENLLYASRAAASIDAVVLLEPVSGAPRYPLLTSDDVVAVIERLVDEHGVENVRMLADLYHLAVNGEDVLAMIERHAALVGHVQVADAPGRHEPGTGELDLEHQLDALQSRGYRGWVALEYIPETTTEAGLAGFDLGSRGRHRVATPGQGVR
jgi:hydroxypyruvate isomerase